MEKLFILALAPVIIILFYIYIRDKYEKEPLRLALIGTFFGIIIAAPIVFTENFIMKFAPAESSIFYPFFISFIVASLVEEAYKYTVLYFLIWKNKNFNEPIDGIVYGAFISLGFALIENILYVFSPKFGGVYTAIGRAVFSVPAHGFFGIFMGYYFAKEKFKAIKYGKFFTFFVPFLLHGLYDILLFSHIPFNGLFFLLVFFYLFISSFKKIKFYLKISPFKKLN